MEEKLSSAASLTHMMNLNTFHGSIFKIKDKDVKDLCIARWRYSAKQEDIGSVDSPDKFVIITVDR